MPAKIGEQDTTSHGSERAVSLLVIVISRSASPGDVSSGQPIVAASVSSLDLEMMLVGLSGAPMWRLDGVASVASAKVCSSRVEQVKVPSVVRVDVA